MNEEIARLSPDTIDFFRTYFDKIMVITIPRATERQEKVVRKLEGLPFEFFYGVDKLTLDPEKILADNIYNHSIAKKNHRYGKGLELGEVACSLSHRKVYEHVIEKGYQRVLIFEDDLVPLLENLHEIRKTFSELPLDWEMIYLGYSKYETLTAGMKIKQHFYSLLSHLGLIKWSPLMVKNLLPRPFSTHLRKAGFHDLLHAYAVNAEACRKLISAQTPVVFIADPLISQLIMNGKLNAFTTMPQFFTQEQFTDPLYKSLIHH
ncbi:MAG: glycosyltransferase family 25 protein [Chitinophagaceae bacterium]